MGISIQPLLGVVLTLFLIAPTAQSQDAQNILVQKQVRRPLNVVVLGDSIMWGQGLRSENKTWHATKQWLAQRIGRPVNERIEAHSGAVIEAGETDQSRVPLDGEVNVAVPSLMTQLERALSYYADGSEVDLVLLSGCVNDLGARYVLNAANTAEEIRLLTEAKCGSLMEELLRRVTSSFPAAYVIVVGYYPFVSEKTRNDMFMRALTKRFYKAHPGASRLSEKAMFKQLVANSDQWHRSSNKSLKETVRTVNTGLGGTKSQERVMFAEVNLMPEHSFRARKTKLWNFESSAIRKLLVILSFGRVVLKPNDDVRKQRAASCKEFWKGPLNETSNQKKERKNEELLCRYAALGHPNRQGALIYTEAIMEHLTTMFPIRDSK